MQKSFTMTAILSLVLSVVTAHFYLFEGFDLRAEYRQDMAANAIFMKSNGTTSKSQGTNGWETVYSF